MCYQNKPSSSSEHELDYYLKFRNCYRIYVLLMLVISYIFLSKFLQVF